MRKLRYIAPGVIAAAAVVGQAVPALAATPKTAGCTNDKFCLYYSAGKGSAIFKTDAASIANLAPFHFANGTGSGADVRNDAHSFNTSALSYALFSKINYSGAVEFLPAETPHGTFSASPLDAGLRNNESSFFSI